MASDSVNSNFFYYTMKAQEEGGKVEEIGKIIEGANWDSLGHQHLITKGTMTYQIIIKKKDNGIYYGYIIRSKDTNEFFKTDHQTASVEEIEGLERIAERRKDLGHFVFVLGADNELVFLTEVGYMVPGMVKITEFFWECFKPHRFFYEPKKNKKQSIIPQITKKKLKSISIRFRKNPEIPPAYAQAEDLLAKIGVDQDYTLEINATMRINKGTDRSKIWNVDEYFSNLFGNPLQKAIDDGIDLPSFLTNLEVEILDEGQQSEPIDVLAQYDKEKISVNKTDISDNESVELWLCNKLAEKVGIESDSDE